MRLQRCISRPGEEGDCYRACLATITGLPIETMPNFILAGDMNTAPEGMWNAVRAFLAPLGLSIFNNYCNGEWSLERVLEYFSEYNRGVPIILTGMALHAPGECHSVIALDGKIVHDPSGAGVSGPVISGDASWWFFDAVCLAHDWREVPCVSLAA